MIVGALEAGGTKMVCAIFDGQGGLVEKVSFKTETPGKTMPDIIDFFYKRKPDVLGIACFGPLNLDRFSDRYGFITNTPKLDWQNYGIYNILKKELGIPVEIDLDVVGSCLGELYFGKGRGLHSIVYITIGTGVGMGLCVDGRIIHGAVHPDAGHMYVRKNKNDLFEGGCPFHGDCLEGLISGQSLGLRYGMPADMIPIGDVVWKYTAEYIAQAVVNVTLTVSPQRIILGGGVMKQEHLFPVIRQNVTALLADYVQSPYLKNIDNYITSSGCADNQGILGAYLLGKKALGEKNDD